MTPGRVAIYTKTVDFYRFNRKKSRDGIGIVTYVINGSHLFAVAQDSVTLVLLRTR